MAFTRAAAYEPRGRVRLVAGIGATLAIHAGAIFLLLQLEAVRSAVRALPIMVSLVAPEKKAEPDPPPKPPPPKPRVQRQPRAEPPPVLTTETPTPAPPFVAPPPAPVPAPVAPPEVPVAAGPVAPPAPPQPLTPPSFNADYLKNPPPAYPAVSRRMREEGKVILRVQVTEQGLTRDVQVRTSSGFPLLDEAALEAVRQWRFVPARRGETPVSAWVLVPIVFSLRS